MHAQEVHGRHLQGTGAAVAFGGLKDAGSGAEAIDLGAHLLRALSEGVDLVLAGVHVGVGLAQQPAHVVAHHQQRHAGAAREDVQHLQGREDLGGREGRGEMEEARRRFLCLWCAKGSGQAYVAFDVW